MQLAWLSLAVAATVAYHLVLKLTPAGANPFLSLLVTYAGVTLLFAVALALGPVSGAWDWRDELRALNWTAVALALAIVALDLGFLFLYRSGFDLSLGALVTQSTAALALLVVGVLVFRERLSPANVLGLALCLAGLWLVNRKG